MASDDDYMAFLNKANEDADTGQQQAAAQSATSGQRKFTATDQGATIPKEIEAVCQRGEVYVTEGDEPFEPVSLKWDNTGLPDEGTLRENAPSSSPLFSISTYGLLTP